MSLDKSLKSHGELVRHRNVLTRAERVQALKDGGKWDEAKDVFGLPKVAHRKGVTRKIKTAAAAVPGAEGAEGEAAAAPAAGEAAPAGKGAAAKAAPGAAAKAAAPKAPPAKGK